MIAAIANFVNFGHYGLCGIVSSTLAVPAQGKFIETRHTEVSTDNLKVSGENLRALFRDLFNC